MNSMNKSNIIDKLEGTDLRFNTLFPVLTVHDRAPNGWRLFTES